MTLVTHRVQRDEIDHVATGKLAREDRTKHGFSLREVARRIGISAMYLSDLERGRRHWSEERMAAFRLALTKKLKMAKCGKCKHPISMGQTWCPACGSCDDDE